MRVVKKSDSIFVRKPEGTEVNYYIFPEYEIHYNEIVPGTVQPWHHHEVIHEVLFIVRGSLRALWTNKEGGKQSQIVSEGDVAEVENTPHTFVNKSTKKVIFLVFRFVPTGKDKREVIKGDKKLDPHLD